MVTNVAYHEAQFVRFMGKFLDGSTSLTTTMEVLSLETEEVHGEAIIKELLEECSKGPFFWVICNFLHIELVSSSCEVPHYHRHLPLFANPSVFQVVCCLHDKLVEKPGIRRSVVLFRRYWFQ